MVNLNHAVRFCLSLSLLILVCVFVEVESVKHNLDEQQQQQHRRVDLTSIRNQRQRQRHRNDEQIEQTEQLELPDQYDQLCSDYEALRKQKKLTRKKKPPKENGKRCKFNKHCQSGCCVIDDATTQRKCASLSKRSEPCTVGQIKGGVYDKFCPCETGPAVCKHVPGTSRTERFCAA